MELWSVREKKGKAVDPLGYFDSSEVSVTLPNPFTNISRASRRIYFVLVCLFMFLSGLPCLKAITQRQHRGTLLSDPIWKWPPSSSCGRWKWNGNGATEDVLSELGHDTGSRSLPMHLEPIYFRHLIFLFRLDEPVFHPNSQWRDAEILKKCFTSPQLGNN